MAEEEKDISKATEAEGQSAAMTREGAPKVNDTETPSAVTDNTVTGTTNASTTANDTGFNPDAVVDATVDAWQPDNNATNATVATTTATPEEVPSWATTDEQGRGRLEQMALQMAGENPTLTPEQREAEAKERNKKMRWAKLNDAIAAMSNLYFTSKYAPNAFDPNNLATKKLRERYDKIDADRDKNRQAWYNVVMPAIKGDTENQRAYYQLQQQAAEKTKDREQQKAISDANINLALQKLDYQKAADEANNALKKQALDETKRHNLAGEYIARLNASVGGQGSNGRYPYFEPDPNDDTKVILSFANSHQEQQDKIKFYQENYGIQSKVVPTYTTTDERDQYGQPTGKKTTTREDTLVSTNKRGTTNSTNANDDTMVPNRNSIPIDLNTYTSPLQ